MSLRPAERRLPPGYETSYFGQASEANGYALISYLSTPLHIHSTNEYVVMRVRDDVLEPNEYRWSFVNGSLVEQVQGPDYFSIQIVPANIGNLQIVVELIRNGSVFTTLALTQSVDGGVAPLRQSLEQYHQLDLQFWTVPAQRDAFSQFGDPKTTRELVEDLRGYVLQAAQQTGVSGVPSRVVASIIYNEILHRPKERDPARPWWSVPGILTSIESSMIEIGTLGGFRTIPTEAIRTLELAIAADTLNAGAPQGGVSLGVCQMQQRTAAMALGLIPWRQLDRASGDIRARVEADRETAYYNLSYESKIDIFNHLRFPKSNISLCARLLSTLKNRANRWPTLDWESFAANDDAIQIVMHEWNIGPTASSANDAVNSLKEGYSYPEDYGPRVFRGVYAHPVMASTFDNALTSAFELYGRVAASGSRADDTRSLKRRLYSLGFFWIAVNDTFDDPTAHAIRLFQSIVRDRHQLGGAGVDGAIDVPGLTYSWLKALNAPRWTPMPGGVDELGFANPALARTDQGYFGTDWLGTTLVGGAAAYQRDYRDAVPSAALLTLHRASLPQGGPFPPSAGHQTGLDCDLRLPRVDGTAGGITYLSSQYDRNAARAQLQALNQEGLFRAIRFNDPQIIAEGLCVAEPAHDDHFHLELKPPPLV